MEFKYIVSEIKERIGYIYLNRLDKKNALNFEFVSELKNQLKNWETENNIKAIILASNSDVFSAGADLDALEKMQTNTFDENLEDSRHLMELFLLILNYPKLVISQVEGHAIAGGCGLATVCDFCFAIPEAKFGYTEVKIGFIPALVSIFLVRKIGEAKAKSLLLTGDLVSSENLYNSGLVHQIYKKEEIKNEVFEWTKKNIASTSNDSIQATKKLINDQWEMCLDDALEMAAYSNAKQRNTEDCKKGIRSFLNKEKLVW
jgi:methylglutaconyl-CoA hydratase